MSDNNKAMCEVCKQIKDEKVLWFASLSGDGAHFRAHQSCFQNYDPNKDSTTGAMVLKLMETSQKLKDNIDRLLRTCGESGICRGANCRQPIVWMKTKMKKNTPYNYDGSTHWANCKAKETFKSGGNR